MIEVGGGVVKVVEVVGMEDSVKRWWMAGYDGWIAKVALSLLGAGVDGSKTRLRWQLESSLRPSDWEGWLGG